MELLDDVGHVESHFGPLGDSVSVGQDRCTVCAKHTIGSEIILDAPDGTHRVYALGFRLKWKLILVHLKIVVILMQDWCMVCTKITIDMEIILDASDGTPR
jgi:hypothetical protein